MWHPDPDQLALAALPAEEPDPGVAAHLAECALCAGHVASLRRTVDLARAGGDTSDDGTGPPERVWRAITEELAIADPPQHIATARTGHRRGRAWWRVAVPAAAALLGLAVGLGIGYTAAPSAPPEPDGAVVALLTPVGDLDPDGTGEVVMLRADDEDRMRVDLRGVPDLDGGDYLEVWLLAPDGTRLVSLGGLTPGDGAYHGTFTVPRGLPITEFSIVDVSVERWDGDPGHSTLSVLRGPLT
ncbi:anti-sigma factor [Pseudonocardia lacus]|uniref:anti-sigma factor n=1 Tax=Pseudonocardia lacus TaxID=2835865 RepID=UPI001BDD3A89|nr:anti-sigma factor [Pseudonocardia lacus]